MSEFVTKVFHFSKTILGLFFSREIEERSEAFRFEQQVNLVGHLEAISEVDVFIPLSPLVEKLFGFIESPCRKAVLE